MNQGEADPEGADDDVGASGPKRVSTSWSEWEGKEQLQQAVVVGSGYGGSVAALRLAEQGWQVTVLERGAEFLPGQFPNDFSHALPAFRLPSIDGRSVLGSASGLWEFRAGVGTAALVGNGVGGGSLINGRGTGSMVRRCLRHARRQ